MLDRLIGFLAAVAVVGAGALAAVALYSVTGAVDPPSIERAIPVAVAWLAVVFLGRPSSDLWRQGALLGLIIGVALLLGVELVRGEFSIGAGQAGALAGAAVTIPLLDAVWGDRFGWRKAGYVALGFVGLLVAVGLVRIVIDGGPFGHDESAYLVKARFWVDGTPDTGWRVHRAPALSVIGVPVLWFTEFEDVYRFVAVVMAVAALAAIALLARRLGGVWTAVLAVLVVGASQSYLRRGSEFLSDVPSAGLLILAVWLVISVFGERRMGARALLWLGPILAAAFYFRYQSALSTVGIAVGAIWAWPKLVRTNMRYLSAAAALLLLALVPHFIWAWSAYGSPLGALLNTREHVVRAYVGEGIVDYVTQFPFELAGPLGAVFIGVGLIWMFWTAGQSFFASRSDADTRLARLSLAAVLVAVVPLGIISHGEPRFVFFPMWLLIAVAAMFFVRLAGRLGVRWVVAAATLAVMIWFAGFHFTVFATDRNAEGRQAALQSLLDASEFMKNDGEGTCGVFTMQEPRVNWYSQCSTLLFRPDSPDLGVGKIGTDREYALLFETGIRELRLGRRQAYLDLGPHTIFPSDDKSFGDAVVVTIR